MRISPRLKEGERDDWGPLRKGDGSRKSALLLLAGELFRAERIFFFLGEERGGYVTASACLLVASPCELDQDRSAQIP